MNLPFKLGITASFISVLLTFFLSFNIHTQLKKSVDIKVSEEYSQHLHDSVKQIDGFIENFKQSFLFLSFINRELLEDRDKLKNIYGYYLNSHKDIDSIVFIPFDNKHDNLIVSKESLVKLDKNEIERIKNTQADNPKGKISISKFYYDNDHRLKCDVSKTLYDINDNKKLGILNIKFSLKKIQDLFYNKLLHFKGAALMDINENKYIIKSDLFDKFSKETFLNLKDQISIIKNGEDNYKTAYMDYHNETITLRLMIIEKDDKPYLLMDNILKNNFADILFSTVVAFLLFTVFIIYILYPIKRLTNELKKRSRMTGLDKDEIKSDKSDEIEMLVDYFNIFMELIETKNKKLDYYNKNLQKRIEQEVAKNTEQQELLMHQSRLAQMGEMISMIAHQWRQPLSAINSTAADIKIKLLMDMLNKKLLEERIDSITEFTSHLSDTIDDFRNFFKKDKIKENIKLQTIVDDSLKIISATLKQHNIKVLKEYEDIPELLTYSSEIKQVVLNILKNAEDALFLKNEKFGKFIRIKLYMQNKDHVIEISDNAGGIDKKDMQSIFKPYFSTKKNKNGTGLGLYMSKVIIEEHCRGKIEAENIKNGALFRIKVSDLD